MQRITQCEATDADHIAITCLQSWTQFSRSAKVEEKKIRYQRPTRRGTDLLDLDYGNGLSLNAASRHKYFVRPGYHAPTNKGISSFSTTSIPWQALIHSGKHVQRLIMKKKRPKKNKKIKRRQKKNLEERSVVHARFLWDTSRFTRAHTDAFTIARQDVRRRGGNKNEKKEKTTRRDYRWRAWSVNLQSARSSYFDRLPIDRDLGWTQSSAWLRH